MADEILTLTIDESGAIVVENRTVQQRLARRPGKYRLVPSAQNLVILPYGLVHLPGSRQVLERRPHAREDGDVLGARPARGLAREQFGLRTSWLQPILMKAKDGGHLSPDDYNNAILTLIRSNFDFVSVDPTLLVWALHGTTALELPDDFIRVAAKLGGPKAELQSHVGVALNAIRLIWSDSRFAPTLRFACVGTLTRNRVPAAAPLVASGRPFMLEVV